MCSDLRREIKWLTSKSPTARRRLLPPGARPPNPLAPKPAAAAHAAPPKAPAVMAATPWESDITQLLKEHFGGEITEFSTYLGQNFLVAKPDAVIAILETLKLELDFDYLVDITAVDYPKRAERFDLVYILYSFARNERMRVKTMIADGYHTGHRRHRASDGQLAGARSVRHVRHPVRGPSRHAPHPAARGMAGLPAAQGEFDPAAGRRSG